MDFSVRSVATVTKPLKPLLWPLVGIFSPTLEASASHLNTKSAYPVLLVYACPSTQSSGGASGLNQKSAKHLLNSDFNGAERSNP